MVGNIIGSVRLIIILMLSCVSCSAQSSAYTAIAAKDGKAHADMYLDAVKVNIRPALRSRLAPVVAAIRCQEDGRKGREYGILDARALDKSYRTQAGWCAATVQKNWDRYLTGGECNNSKCTIKHKPGNSRDMQSYICYLGHVYCPVGADNDPKGLNRNWIGNVKKIVDKFAKGGSSNYVRCNPRQRGHHHHLWCCPSRWHGRLCHHQQQVCPQACACDTGMC